MKARFLWAIAIALILLLLPALVLAQGPVASTGPSGDGAGVAPLGSPDVLWNQPTDYTSATIDSYFPDYGSGVYSADDFSNAQPWNIELIFVDGFGPEPGYGQLTQADSLHWLIYLDAGGVPAGDPDIGGHLWSHTCLPSAPEVTISGANNDQATLDIVKAQGTQLYLAPGTYWLCFYPSLNFTLYGQWFWRTAGTTNLAIAQVIDRYGLVGLPPVWSPWTLINPATHDAAFRLEGCGGECLDYGDAPEGALAYPSTGVTGAFPTCKDVPIAGWIQHNNFGTWFGPGFDFESDGNHGLCPGFAPYDNDECFGDGDAGLILPEPYTIQGGVVAPCGNSMGTPLGSPCESAQWGSDIDILIHNWMPGHTTYLPGYVNVLIDWNQDGQWQNDPATTCDGSMVPEHVLVDFLIPPQYDGTLSALGPPPFQIGPNDGYVWVRFSITEDPVGGNWTGEGEFEDGETEDYLLRIYVPPPVGGEAYPASKASLMAPWIAMGVVLAGGISWYILRRRSARI